MKQIIITLISIMLLSSCKEEFSIVGEWHQTSRSENCTNITGDTLLFYNGQIMIKGNTQKYELIDGVIYTHVGSYIMPYMEVEYLSKNKLVLYNPFVYNCKYEFTRG